MGGWKIETCRGQGDPKGRAPHLLSTYFTFLRPPLYFFTLRPSYDRLYSIREDISEASALVVTLKAGFGLVNMKGRNKSKVVMEIWGWFWEQQDFPIQLFCRI